MLRAVKDYFSPLVDLINKIRNYLSDHRFITDLVTRLVITFGVVLIIGGLYLMIGDSGPHTTAAIRSVTMVVVWIPGIPFSFNYLASTSAVTIGLVSWFIGMDLLLLGLGLWVRHWLARFVGLLIFALAALFQFLDFLNVGIMGAPASIPELIVSGIFIYFLVSRFDSTVAKPLRTSFESCF